MVCGPVRRLQANSDGKNFQGWDAKSIELVYRSYWQQEVKRGHDVDLPDFVRSNDQVARLDYGAGVDRWAAVFGKDRLRIIIYDDVRAAGQELFAYFAGALGLPADRLTVSEPTVHASHQPSAFSRRPARHPVDRPRR